MKKIYINFNFILISIIFISFVINSCNIKAINEDKYNKLPDNIHKDIIVDYDMFYLIDSLIHNFGEYDKIIRNSKYFNPNFSSVDYWKSYNMSYLQECFINGYEIIDSYILSYTDNASIPEYVSGFERYPINQSYESKNVLKIANIFLKIKNQRIDPNKNNGCLIFTFCQTINGDWYIRIIFPEFYDVMPSEH